MNYRNKFNVVMPRVEPHGAIMKFIDRFVGSKEKCAIENKAWEFWKMKGLYAI